MLRHKAIKKVLEKGKAEEWNDDHTIDPSNIILFWDDFIEGINPNRWDTGQTTGSGDVYVAFEDNHMFIKLDSGTTSGSVASMRLKVGNVTHKDDLPIAVFSVNAVNKDKLEFGLMDWGTDPFTANQSGAYFRIKAGKVYAVVGNGSNETEIEIATAQDYNVYWIKFTSTNVQFYVGDRSSPVASIDTNIPGNPLTIKISAGTYDTTAQVLRTDFVGLIRNRKNA